MKGIKINTNIYTATIYQFAVALIMLWLSRFAFAWYNWEELSCDSFASLLKLSLSGLRFDLSAALYFNVLFLAMRIMPFKFTERPVYIKVSNIVYLVCNSLLLAINIGDIPYFRFTGSRLRWSNVENIFTDSGIGGIMLSYIGDYWWVYLLVIIAVVVLITATLPLRVHTVKISTAWRCVMMLLFAGACFSGMRGHLGRGVPLAIPDAAFAVDKAPQINVVLNSPFCVLRSLNKSKANTEPVVEFFGKEELCALRNSVHNPSLNANLCKRNVVIIIIESGGAVFSDYLSPLEKVEESGLMPVLDSLARKSVVFKHTFACSRSSQGGATAILAGFPAFDPFYFMLSPYNKNELDSPAWLLGENGWSSVFFYGCKHGSFNIDQTAYAAGFREIVDLETYGNMDDFDGNWGVFDIPMAKYVVKHLSAKEEPFIASWFTISAHIPFNIPDNWDTSAFKHPERSPERGMEYTDQALGVFFDLASKEPWFMNTTFVITADHGSRDLKGRAEDTDYIRNHIPFLIYAPDGSIKPRMIDDRIISQHDIGPTVLSLLGYNRPYVSVGTDAFSADSTSVAMVRSEGAFTVFSSDYTIRMDKDMNRAEQVFCHTADPLLQRPLSVYDTCKVENAVKEAQAFMQDFSLRLNADRLSIKKENIPTE